MLSLISSLISFSSEEFIVLAGAEPKSTQLDRLHQLLMVWGLTLFSHELTGHPIPQSTFISALKLRSLLKHSAMNLVILFLTWHFQVEMISWLSDWKWEAVFGGKYITVIYLSGLGSWIFEWPTSWAERLFMSRSLRLGATRLLIQIRYSFMMYQFIHTEQLCRKTAPKPSRSCIPSFENRLVV